MARRKDEHQAQLDALNALGTALNRRSKSRCELCGKSTSLKVIAIPPLYERPSIDAAIFSCEQCVPLTTTNKDLPEANTLRFLETKAWSDVRPVQLVAVRALKRLSHDGIVWATEALEGLYLAPEIEADV